MYAAAVGSIAQATNLINLRKTQIYTKRGNVEMPLTGHMSDFENAILLDKITLIKTNALIQVRIAMHFDANRPHSSERHMVMARLIAFHLFLLRMRAPFTGGRNEKTEHYANGCIVSKTRPVLPMEIRYAEDENRRYECMHTDDREMRCE